MSQLGKEHEYQPFYNHPMEHLSDHLRRLDLLLKVKLQKNDEIEGSYQKYQGLAITREEIDARMSVTENNPFLDERLDPLYQSIALLDREIEQKVCNSRNQGIQLPLDHIARVFKLSPFEVDCILICLSVELDKKYEKVFAYLNDDIACKRPTLGLVLELLCKSMEETLRARFCFTDGKPLMEYFLEAEDNQSFGAIPYLSRPLELDNRIVDYLLGFPELDTKVAQVVHIAQPIRENEGMYMPGAAYKRMKQLVELVSPEGLLEGKKTILYFHGKDDASKEQAARIIADHAKKPLLLVDLLKFLFFEKDFHKAMIRLERECILKNAVLCFHPIDILLKEEFQIKFKILLGRIGKLPSVSVLLGEDPFRYYDWVSGFAFLEEEFSTYSGEEDKALWEHFGSRYLVDSEVCFEALSGQFKFTSGQIRDVLSMARVFAALRSQEEGRLALEDIYKASHLYSNKKMGGLAQKIEAKYTWEDLVLPKDKMDLLKEVCNHLKYRHIVYGHWGFGHKLSYGKGLSVLFSGPSGTGKTMAAQVIANELGLLLYRVDLSQVVSKYIGETEKNLNHIFDEAESSNAILFFDEADALFGKRSEVKDAHDRYANIETAYLLQKMEGYEGVSILATNLKNNMDDAFMRRLSFCVDFPFPGMDSRKKIWQAVFPRQTPVDPAVDFEELARVIELSGGNIKNIAVASAFLAAAENAPITLTHIVKGAHHEYKKIGRSWKGVEGGQSPCLHEINERING